jgi:tRNA(fMet)-specific endonuclease VapC
VEKYAEMKVLLRRNGTPMNDEFDLIIGLTALVNDLVLVTDNIKDFRYIPDLLTENWYVRK